MCFLPLNLTVLYNSPNRNLAQVDGYPLPTVPHVSFGRLMWTSCFQKSLIRGALEEGCQFSEQVISHNSD